MIKDDKSFGTFKKKCLKFNILQKLTIIMIKKRSKLEQTSRKDVFILI